jgi:hypothetical protein
MIIYSYLFFFVVCNTKPISSVHISSYLKKKFILAKEHKNEVIEVHINKKINRVPYIFYIIQNNSKYVKQYTKTDVNCSLLTKNRRH